MKINFCVLWQLHIIQILIGKVKTKMKIERKVDELIANGNINKEHRDLAIETLELAKYEEGDDNNPALKLLSGLKVVDTKTYSEVDVEEGEAKKKKENKEVDEDAELLQKYEELVNNGVDPEIANEKFYWKILKKYIRMKS